MHSTVFTWVYVLLMIMTHTLCRKTTLQRKTTSLRNPLHLSKIKACVMLNESFRKKIYMPYCTPTLCDSISFLRRDCSVYKRCTYSYALTYAWRTLLLHFSCESMWNNESEAGDSKEAQAMADEFFNKTDNYFCLGSERSQRSLLFYSLCVAWYTAQTRF